MINEEQTLGLSVKGNAKDCYNTEQERLDDYAQKLAVSTSQGQQGSQGTVGSQGQQGLTGPKGDKGDKGDTGATGSSPIVVTEGAQGFDNGVDELTIAGKNLTKAYFSLYAIDQTLATYPANNRNTSISRIDYDGTDTIVFISAVAVDESPTVLTSNLAVRWRLVTEV